MLFGSLMEISMFVVEWIILVEESKVSLCNGLIWELVYVVLLEELVFVFRIIFGCLKIFRF